MTDKTDDDYTVPFSMRLTRAQRRKLDEDAGGKALGEYVRSCLFENPTPLKRTFRRPVQDKQILSAVLAELGRSRMSSNLNQIAKAIHTGAYPASTEAERVIFDACADLKAICNNITQALGFPPEIRP